MREEVAMKINLPESRVQVNCYKLVISLVLITYTIKVIFVIKMFIYYNTEVSPTGNLFYYVISQKNN